MSWGKRFDSFMRGFVPQDIESGHLRKRLKWFIHQTIKQELQKFAEAVRLEEIPKGEKEREAAIENSRFRIESSADLDTVLRPIENRAIREGYNQAVQELNQKIKEYLKELKGVK